MDARDPLRAAALAVVATAGFTALVVVGDVRAVQLTAASGVALDSISATIGVLLGALFYGRSTVTSARRDVLICAALFLLGWGNALLAVVPVVLGGAALVATASGVATWSAVLLAAAVWGRPAEVDAASRRSLALRAAAPGVVVGALFAGVVRLVGTTRPDPLLVADGLTAALLLVSAAGWCRARNRGDGLAASMAVAGVLAAGFRLDLALSSSTSSAWVTAASVLRVGFYVALLAPATTEIRAYWTSRTDAAVFEERRRIARDLHDGLAQELAFIATQSRVLAQQSDSPRRAQLVAGAAERALDESRRAIAALTRPLDEPLDVAVVQCAEEVCGRYGGQLVLDVDSDVTVSADAREALLRIVREALSNAFRHGGARSVVVRLHGTSVVRLRVEDDGTGFNAADVDASAHFGLVSMRERAEALGGTLALATRRPHGTTVEVVLP